MDPREALPSLLHSPLRLAALALLRTVQSTDFQVLAAHLDVTPQELSRQLAILEDGGMIEIAKRRKGRQAVTQIRLSEQGRARFERYLVVLSHVLQQPPPDSTKTT